MKHLLYKKSLALILGLLFFAMGGSQCARPKMSEADKMQNLKEAFVDLRFGMFICYNIMSYGANWGEANYPIDSFNPQKLDCNQWADLAKKAGMTFGLLTTKHHEGFCLWDSKYTDYDVASTPYKKDIVRQYVDAFRAKGLEPALYYSIWDASNGIDKDHIGRKELDFIKGQLTELLSNYGEIKYLVFDGWFWRMNHHEVPFIEIREHIRSLQPNCLITDHTHLQAPYHVDIPYFEGPFGAFPAEDNTMASALGHCSVKGNGWFWSEQTPHGLKKNESANSIVDRLKKLESRYCNFMLNCMPNRDGLMDTLYIDLLEEIGDLYHPNMNRPVLPKQDLPILYEVAPVSASADIGNAMNAIDGSKIPGKNYTDWIGGLIAPQSLTLDLGALYKGIELLNVVPKHRCKPGPETSLQDGNLTHSKLYASQDGETYVLVSENHWNADGKMRAIEFEPQTCRYLKLEIIAWEGESPVITELALGAYSKPLEKL